MSTELPPQIAIGNQGVPFTGKPAQYGGYRIVVVDRRTLEVVVNEYTEQFDQAPDIGQYDTSDYFLVVSSVSLGTGHVPQGAFYDFLYDNGAGRELKRVVQLNETLSCGTYQTVSYALVGVLGPGKPELSGVEVSALTETATGAFLTAQLVPIEIAGVTYYTPTPLSG